MTVPAAVSAANTAVMQLDHVWKRFPGVDAVAGISLAVPRGTILGLLGPNGSGKSTLLKLMAGLHRPSRGQVLVEGRPPDRTTKARIAYVPEVDALYPGLSVAETLSFVSRFFADWEAERAARLVDFMALPARRPVGSLSKGMRARLRLLLALARRAHLILLDEPLSGIDAPSRTRIVDAILSEYRAEEQTIVLSTHEILETESLFERLVLLEGGRVKLEGEAEELRQRHGKSIRDLLGEVYA